ncbi:MAG: hypothetical protein Q4D16_11045 [Eubacteriales bacterium]|nr:hypothetical protein [Eubacteriales bacterium]
MTKLKNTKKGMAKKALSISLVAAMLATSNVPVWAAEDLFSDGSAVEAEVDTPFTEETPDTALFSSEAPAEEAPVTEEAPVEDVVSDAAVVAAADTTEDVNLLDYEVKDLKLNNIGEWGTDTVSVAGSIQSNGNDVQNLQYVWLADGLQADGADAADTASGNISTITYTPTKADYNKTLSLRIYQTAPNGMVLFSKTIAGSIVQAQDISTDFNAALTLASTAPSYNGTEQKPTPSNTYSVTKDGLSLDGSMIDWHYETEGNDFTNVTEKDITVYGTLTGTNDSASNAYGYTARTAEATYQIAPLELSSSNLKPSMVTTSVEYTGDVQTFGKKDVKLEVLVNANTNMKTDITAALKADATFSGAAADKSVGTDYKLDSSTDWAGAFDTSDAANEILKNFEVPSSLVVNVENTYAITKRNLSNCTGTITEQLLSTFRGNPDATVSAADITLTDKSGRTFTLAALDTAGQITIQVNNAVFAAANANKTGVVQNAVTVSYAADSDNVTGSLNLPMTLVTRSLGTVTVTKDGSANTVVPTSKADAGNLTVPYIGKAYSLTGTTGTLNSLNIAGADPSEYDVAYNDNVNAGIVEVTITGKSSLAGSTKKVYFTIAQHEVNSGFTVKNGVTVNPANNSNAALYKDALGMEFKTRLTGATSDTTLKEGTDYTVKYYYTNGNTYADEAAVKADLATNVAGKYVTAIATPVKNGNFKLATVAFIYDSAVIAKKSISNVTITVEKDSYTFTGKEIVPNIVVKDGTVTLDKGVDYNLKLKDNIDVGTATITVVPTAGSDYAGDTAATTTFKIEAAKAEDVKATLSATASAVATTGKDNTFNYTGRQVKPSVSKVELNGVDVTKYFDITYITYGENVNAGKEMGSVVISPKADVKNFTGTKTHLFNIQGKELDGVLKLYKNDKTQVVTTDHVALTKTGGDIYNFYYDGSEQTFADAKFTPAAATNAKEGTDYEIKYINNKDAGIAFAAVVAKGNYEANIFNSPSTPSKWDDFGYKVVDGTLMTTAGKIIEKNIVDIYAFNITPSIFTAKNITVANGSYAGGMPVKPSVTISVNGKTLEEGTDYALKLTAIDGTSTPDTYVNVTTDKPYIVRVIPMGGYGFDAVNGPDSYTWGIDKKNLEDCFVKVTRNKDELDLVVMNGNVTETKEVFDVKDNGDGTATVSVVNDGKNYTGSTSVTIIDPTEEGTVGPAMIDKVVVNGNKATVVLSGEAENADGYDYVIATQEDYKNGRVAINKNLLTTTTDFRYVDRGVYYAYCHAWKRDENGKKVFGDWSNLYRFEVSAVTPDQPVITSVKVTGKTVKVTYTKSDDATGYDLVLGTAVKKVYGENRPVNYGKLVKKVTKGDTVTATFTNVPKGTYYAGLHAYNRTSMNNTKVFSVWSNTKKVTVK